MPMQEALLLEIRILRDKDKAVLLRVAPNCDVLSVTETELSDVRATRKQILD